MSHEQRKLAAILAADVVGYSRLVGEDESATHRRVTEHLQSRLNPVLARHNGRQFKHTGDGALVEFSSAVDALRAAIEFQQLVADANMTAPSDNPIVFRVGVHVGDVIVDGNDLFGEGVIIAARLEGNAPKGGIALSEAAFKFVEQKVSA